MIRDQKDRADRVIALRTMYLCGEITESVYRASLHGVGGMTGEDIRYELGLYRPPERDPDFEDHRLDASREWLRSYHGR